MTATMKEHEAAHVAALVEQSRCWALGYVSAKVEDGDRRLADEADQRWFADQFAAAELGWGQVRRLYDDLAEARYAEHRAAELAAERRS